MSLSVSLAVYYTQTNNGIYSFCTFLTETLPLKISFVVARIEDQFSKTVYGIPSRSQKVIKSGKKRQLP